MTEALSSVVGVGVGYGVLLAVIGLHRLRGPRLVRRPLRAAWAQPRELALAGAIGLAAFIVTRWPMAFLLGGAAFLGLQGLGPGRARQSVAKLEAIAVWTEMLRDTLAGAAGLTQALVTTAAQAPAPLSEPAKTLAARLNGGVELDAALRELAAAVEDPAADLVVAALLMASRERAQRLGDLLGALSSSIRDEVAMRLGIEAERTSSRSAVRMITGFSLAFFVLMAVFARGYLLPYRSSAGQLALAGVGVLFGLGLWMMAVMVRPRPMPRLVLASEGDPVHGASRGTGS